MEFERDGAEGHGWIAAGAVFGGAIHRIADDGQVSIGEVEADLMGAAGDGAGFDEGKIVSALENFEVRFCIF